MSNWCNDEWWAAVSSSSDTDLQEAVDETRLALGIIGDPEDAA